jgi:transcriptional regulator with XRE-family HTH domain
MNTTTLTALAAAPTMTLGGFLRARRARLAPAPGVAGRRRTPGLRREEVAARAGVSVTWYTWLEQGRGGPPSDHVLEQLSEALELDSSGREVLFLLAQQRPPPLKVTAMTPPVVAPALQRVLDGMPFSPAIIKTPTWDVIAWNAPAAAVLGNYGDLPMEERNVLRRLFGSPEVRQVLPEWEANARFAIGVFRVDIARAGDQRPEIGALAAELLATNAEFRRLWAENDVSGHWTGRKHFSRPDVGEFELETTAYAVDGSDSLSMIVFTPVGPEDVKAVERLMAMEASRA